MKKKAFHLDSDVIKDNKLDSRGVMTSFDTMDDYNNGIRSFRQPLNGQWQYKIVEALEELPIDTYEQTFDDVSWDEMLVPGIWNVDKEINNACLFRKTFEWPKEAVNQVAYVHFEAVKAAFYLWINGHYVGYSQGSMLPSEFDITSYIDEGENKIELIVYRYCDISHLEDERMWHINGIYKDVYLYTGEEQHIDDLYVRSEFGESMDVATLKVKVAVQNVMAMNVPLKLNLYLGKEGEALTKLVSGRMVAKELQVTGVLLESVVTDIDRWSANRPNLYQVVVELTDHLDNVLDVQCVAFGFRQIVYKEEHLFINGERVAVRGVDLDECLIEASSGDLRSDYKQLLKELKGYNVNTIKHNPYYYGHEIYELCDQYGFYMVDDIGLCGNHLTDTKMFHHSHHHQGAMIDITCRLVKRDRNHPCVIAWSLGDITSSNKTFVPMRNKMIALDDTRVYFEASNPLETLSRTNKAFIKNSYRPFDIKIGEGCRTYEVVCRNKDIEVDDFDLFEVLIEDGEIQEESQIDVILNIEESTCGELTYATKELSKDSELYIQLDIRHKKASWCTEIGDLLTANQRQLTNVRPSEGITSGEGICRVDENDSEIRVTGDILTLCIDKSTGYMNQIRHKDLEMLKEPIRPDFTMLAEHYSAVKDINYEQTGNLVVVMVKAKVKGFEGVFNIKYEISNKDEFTVTYEGTPKRLVHKFGSTLTSKLDLTQVSFYGKGPDVSEAYDSNGALVGIHHMTLREFVPNCQDEGVNNHSGVRWISFSDEKGNGLMIEHMGADTLNIGACLHEKATTFLTIDHIRGNPNGSGYIEKGRSYLYGYKYIVIVGE